MNNDWQIQTEVFSGPIELLLYLVRKNEVDIFDVPLAKITDEYLTYIKQASSLNIEMSSDFILMAALLVRFKIMRLLPSSEIQEELPESKVSLEEIIEEYKKYSKIAQLLGEMAKKRALIFSRPGSLQNEILEGEGDLYLLISAFGEILSRRRESPSIEIQVADLKLEDKLTELQNILKNRIKISFSLLVQNSKSLAEAILFLIALLELVRLGEVRISQSEEYSDIILEKVL
jgi:segregation and condensation protein A